MLDITKLCVDITIWKLYYEVKLWKSDSTLMEVLVLFKLSFMRC